MNKFHITFVVYLMVFICFEPIVSRETKRGKKDVDTVVSIVAELGPPVYEVIREYLKKKKCGKKVSSSMVNDYYNTNMQNSQNLKDAVAARMAEAGDAIHMKAAGYHCNDEYCKEMGLNVTGSMGICTKQYCVCSGGVAERKTCGWFKVYDPMNNRCSTTGKSILCH